MILDQLVKFFYQFSWYRTWDRLLDRYIWGIRPVSRNTRWRDSKTGKFAKFDIKNLLKK